MHYLFVRRSNKQKMRSGIISDFTKVIIIIIFFIFYNNQVILRVISQCTPPFLHPLSKKRSSPVLQFGQEENIPGDSYERRIYFRIYFRILTSRTERGRWTLLQWLRLPPCVRDSLEDKFLLAPSKKCLPSPFSLAKNEKYTWLSFERRAYWFVLKAIMVFPIPRGRLEKVWWKFSTLQTLPNI